MWGDKASCFRRSENDPLCRPGKLEQREREAIETPLVEPRGHVGWT